jgi:hypothetical protein
MLHYWWRREMYKHMNFETVFETVVIKLNEA